VLRGKYPLPLVYFGIRIALGKVGLGCTQTTVSSDKQDGGTVNRSILKFLLVLVGVALFTAVAAADSFTFNISGTIPSSGSAVTSTVTITSTGTSLSDANRGFDIKVVNTTANPANITQILDAIQFNLKNGISLGTTQLKSASATIRDIAPNGTYTDTNSTSLGTNTASQIDWGLVTGSAFKLCAGAYGTTSCPLHPDGIVGPAANNNQYPLANPSITNDQHSPELFGTLGKPVTFHVYASSVTASTMIANVIDSAQFYYGTSGGKDNIQVCVNCGGGGGGGGNTPEPASIFLLGSGVVGIASRLRKRK